MTSTHWITRVLCALLLACAAMPAAADGRSEMADFEKWYAEHPADFDAAATKLKAIMEKYGGRDTAAAARMRMKEVEGDRERAAQDWYEGARKTAEAKLAAGDVTGSIAIMGKVPAPYRGTSSGARGKMWARNCAEWAQQQLRPRSRSITRAIDAGELDRAQRELDAMTKIANGLRTGLPADLQGIVPQYDRVVEAETKRLHTIREARRLRASVQPDLDAAAAAAERTEWQAMFDAAKRIRATLGPPAEGETGLRREAETLWITAATKLATWPAEYQGRGEVTPDGNRVTYDFEQPAQLGDWEVTPTGARCEGGALKLDKNMKLWHRARWPLKVRVATEAPLGAVLQLHFGDAYYVTVVSGFRVIIGKGKERLADEKQQLPRGTKGPVTVEVVRAGGAFTVTWGGVTLAEVADPDPAPDALVSRLAVSGSWKGAALPNLTLYGKPTFEVPEPPAEETEATPEEPAEDLPTGWQKLRHPVNALKGWAERGGSKWSSRGSTELMNDAWKKGERIRTFVHNETSERKFTEYEFAVEMRFVKHRNGSAPGLIFRVKGETVAWLFDNEGPSELIGLSGGGKRGTPRGTLLEGTQMWQTVRIKVKSGKITGYIGKAKSWEIKVEDATAACPDKVDKGGKIGLCTRGGFTAFRNPTIKFYK
jgi:hypothetical protein